MPVWFNTFEARLQLKRLARENDILVTYVANWLRAEAFPRARMVDIPEPRTRQDYMVALHEFGHVLAGPDERDAWAWAHAHAIVG